MGILPSLHYHPRAEGRNIPAILFGRIHKLGFYYQNKKEGISRSYPGDFLFSQLGYRNDLHHGEYIIYHPNSTVREITPYINGVKSGVHRQYDDDGKLLKLAIWINDETETILDHSDEYDDEYVLNTYYDYEKEGITIIYSHGSITSISFYHKGKLHGISRTYYESGNISQRGYNHHLVEYDETNGNITWSMTDNVSIYYDEDGLIREINGRKYDPLGNMEEC